MSTKFYTVWSREYKMYVHQLHIGNAESSHVTYTPDIDRAIKITENSPVYKRLADNPVEFSIVEATDISGSAVTFDKREAKVLWFLYYRLLRHYEENENYDYMINFKEIIEKVDSTVQR